MNMRPEPRDVLFDCFGLDGHRQHRRKPTRCQRTTVSGFTVTRTSVQRDQKRRRLVQKDLSREFKVGRGRLRSSSDLLPEGKDFEGHIGTTAEEDADGNEDGADEFRHELTVVTWRNVVSPRDRLRTASL